MSPVYENKSYVLVFLNPSGVLSNPGLTVFILLTNIVSDTSLILNKSILPEPLFSDSPESEKNCLYKIWIDCL